MRKWVRSSIRAVGIGASAVNGWQTVVQQDSIEALHQYRHPLVQVAGLSSLARVVDLLLLLLLLLLFICIVIFVLPRLQQQRLVLCSCTVGREPLFYSYTFRFYYSATLYRHCWYNFSCSQPLNLLFEFRLRTTLVMSESLPAVADPGFPESDADSKPCTIPLLYLFIYLLFNRTQGTTQNKTQK